MYTGDKINSGSDVRTKLTTFIRMDKLSTKLYYLAIALYTAPFSQVDLELKVF